MSAARVTDEAKLAELNVHIAEEAGVELDAVSGEYYADPQNAGVYAARIELYGETVDLLIHADGELEEVEFSQWPPRVAAWAGGRR